MLAKHLSIFLQKFNQKSALNSLSTVFIQEWEIVGPWVILLLIHLLILDLFLLFFYNWHLDGSHVLPNFLSCQGRLLLLLDQLLGFIFHRDLDIFCFFPKTFLFLESLICLQKFCSSFVFFDFLESYFVKELLGMRSDLAQRSVFHVLMNFLPVFPISLEEGLEEIRLSSRPSTHFISLVGGLLNRN